MGEKRLDFEKSTAAARERRPAVLSLASFFKIFTKVRRFEWELMGKFDASTGWSAAPLSSQSVRQLMGEVRFPFEARANVL